MTELRWLRTREFVNGTFSAAIPQEDGTVVYQRLQYRNVAQNLVEAEAEWQEVPVFAEMTEAPRIALIRGGKKP